MGCACGWWCSPFESCNGELCNGKDKCGVASPHPQSRGAHCACGPEGCKCSPLALTQNTSFGSEAFLKCDPAGGPCGEKDQTKEVQKLQKEKIKADADAKASDEDAKELAKAVKKAKEDSDSEAAKASDKLKETEKQAKEEADDQEEAEKKLDKATRKQMTASMQNAMDKIETQVAPGEIATVPTKKIEEIENKIAEKAAEQKKVEEKEKKAEEKDVE